MSRLMFPPTLLLNLPTRTSRGKKQNQNILSNWSRLSLHLQWWRQSWLARISHLGHLWPSLLLNGPSLWPWLPVILINVGWKIILFNSYRKFGFNQWQQSGDTIKYKISQHMVNSFHFSCQVYEQTNQPGNHDPVKFGPWESPLRVILGLLGTSELSAVAPPRTEDVQLGPMWLVPVPTVSLLSLLDVFSASFR